MCAFQWCILAEGHTLPLLCRWGRCCSEVLSSPPVLTRCPGASSSSGGSLELASGLWSPLEAAGIWVSACPIYISSAKNGKIGGFGGGGGLGSALWVGEWIQLMGVVVMECDLRVPLCGCPLVWVSPGLGVPWHGCPLVWVPLGVGTHHFFGAVGCSLLPKAP